MVSDAQDRDELIDYFVWRIQRLGIARIALLTLQSLRPLSFLSSQALLMMQPMIDLLIGEDKMDAYVALLEDPAAVDELIKRLEHTP
jgi:hypothetical protein